MFDDLGRKAFEAGEIVFAEGDPGDCAYIIDDGAVEIRVLNRNGEPSFHWIGKGELFGEVALIDCQARTATVRAVEHSTLIPIHREQVMELLEKSDPIVRHLLLLVLERFRENAQLTAGGAAGLKPGLSAGGGRGRLRGEATGELILTHEMRRAVGKNEFELHYQPISDLVTRHIVGFEALIRWRHPERGLIPPLDFLWLAERTGQIREIGRWTLDRATIDWPRLRTRTEHEQPFISVNLSANQLTGDGLVRDIESILARNAMPPGELKLELTENVIIDNPDLARDLLGKLTAKKIKLALDDYGTGYSGLDSLQRYPLDTMKIDRVFVGSMLATPRNHDIVRSSIALAHSLGMNVVAEGIENEETLLALLELGCNFGQGWHLGRPEKLPGG